MLLAVCCGCLQEIINYLFVQTASCNSLSTGDGLLQRGRDEECGHDGAAATHILGGGPASTEGAAAEDDRPAASRVRLQPRPQGVLRGQRHGGTCP